MITKLPRWIWTGAWILSFVGGMVNVVGFLGFTHQAITHLTGTASMLALALGAGDTATALHLAATIGSFVLGCVLSGFLIQDSALQLGYRYGAVLFLEAALLFAAIPLLNHGNEFGIYAASFACGLQNAMVSTYSGAVIRTTHVSGMFTDLGIYLGHALRGLPVDLRRLRLSGIVISGFISGGLAGGLSFPRLKYATLAIPASIAALTSVAYAIHRVCHMAKARS